MSLHPQLANWLEQVNLLAAQRLAAGQQLTPIGARESLARLIAAFVPAGPELPWVNETMLPGDYSVPVRIYHPAPDEALPVLVYCHGGGHMAGSVSSYDPLCRRLARQLRHIVVSVEYRLAPECPYPAARDDVKTVLRGLRSGLSLMGVKAAESAPVLAGDSGGAAIAATIAQAAQHDDTLSVGKLMLIYPSLDYRMALPSVTALGQGYLLEASRMAWYFDHYFKPGDDRLAASPLLGEITDNHAPVLVITAGFDPLRDEGAAYAQRLAANGVPVRHRCAEDMIHAFLLLETLVPEACSEAYALMAAFLADAA